MIGELAALGASVSWAIAPILYRKALLNTKPISANIVRTTTNAGLLVTVLLLFGLTGALTSLPTSTMIFVVASGIVGLGIGDTLYMIGLKHLGVSRAVPLAATYPLFSVVWATFLLRQSLTLTAVLGAVVIIVGIWLLSRQKNGDASDVKGKPALVGVIVSLMAAVVWSISISLMNVAVSNVSGTAANYAIITLRISSVALFFLVLAPFIDKQHGFMKMSKLTVATLCIGGLVANGLGWFLMNYSMLNTSLARAVPISSTSPLFAAIAGFMLFNEKMTPKAVLGAAAIVAGICLIFVL